MKTIDHRGFSVCVFHGQDHDELQDVLEVHTAWLAAGADRNRLIFVPLEGYAGDELPPENFIIKNYSASLVNHFMWKEVWDQDGQDKEMLNLVDRFIDTGEQAVIENYEYVPDEPFYDYSGGQ